MNNLERLFLLSNHDSDSNSANTKLMEISSCPYREYIDFSTWLKSTEPNYRYFTKIKGTCVLLPSVAEAQVSGFRNKEEIESYRQRKQKLMLVLETDYKMYNTPHIRLLNTELSNIYSVPEHNISNIIEKEEYAIDALREHKILPDKTTPESTDWQSYICYLLNWIRIHSEETDTHPSPSTYDDWYNTKR